MNEPHAAQTVVALLAAAVAEDDDTIYNMPMDAEVVFGLVLTGAGLLERLAVAEGVTSDALLQELGIKAAAFDRA
jgi:hypothetical protein